MQLVLMRHGIAVDRDDPTCPPDGERPLTEPGRERSRIAAEGLAQLLDAPDRVFTSPLVRARQTAEVAARALGAPAELHVTDTLEPHRQPDDLLQLLLAQGLDTVLCVGHAPQLDRVVAHLLGTPRLDVTRLKKAGVAWLVLDAAGAELVALLPPRVLRRLAAGAS